MRISPLRIPGRTRVPLFMLNLIRCGLIAAIVALPPTAGCRGFFKGKIAVASVSLQAGPARG
jgi:hypothetical protein